MEQKAERERQRELAEAEKRRQMREDLQEAQRNDFSLHEMKRQEERQMEDYHLQQVCTATTATVVAAAAAAAAAATTNTNTTTTTTTTT